MAAPYTKHQSDWLFTQQAAWGTEDITDLQRLNCEPADFNPDLKQRLSNRSYVGNTVVTPEALIHDFKGAAPFVTLRGPVRELDIDHLLYAVLQDVAESVDAPPIRTFEVPAVGQIDFPVLAAIDDAGYIMTLLKQQPVAGKSSRIKDAICRRLKLSNAPDANEGRLFFEADFIGRGEMTFDDTLAGTSVAVAETYYHFHDHKAFTIDGTPMILLGWELEILNNGIPWGNDTANLSEFYSYAMKHDITMKCKVAWSSDAHDVALLVATEASNHFPVILEFGTAAAAGHLKFDMESKVGPAPELDEDPLKAIDFMFTAIDDGTNKPLEVTQTSATDRGWQT